MPGTLALSLLAILSGTVLTYLYDRQAFFAARLCAGACTGYASLALIGFFLASFLGLGPLTLLLAGVAIASPILLLLKPTYRAQWRGEVTAAARALWNAARRPTRNAVIYFIFSALVLVFLLVVFDRVLFERPDGLCTGFTNNLGDLPFHLQIITSFAHGGNFPPQDPAYAGARFAYPFLADFVAAMFVSGGASLRSAILVQNLVLALALVGLLHRWTCELARDRLAGLLAPVLLLFSGGLGWWLLFGDLRESEHGLFTLLKRLPHDYTIFGQGWRWGNSLTTLLVPQRSFLFGLPVAVCVFTQWWLALARQQSPSDSASEKNGDATRRMAAAGLLAGTLPLIHTHSFLVVMGMGACLALLFPRWRAWAIFFAVALALAVPQLLWVMQGNAVKAQTFFGWSFGWDRGNSSAIWFWFKNTGLFIPLVVAAILWRREVVPAEVSGARFYLPFTLCFAVPNLVKLAPWIWDNIKVLFYWYLASVPLVAWLLARLWQRAAKWRVAAGVLLVALTLAGALDLWRVITRTTSYREFDRDGIAIADQIRRHTPPRAVVLHAPTFNSPVCLAGRLSVLGYPGIIWSRGLDAGSREADIRLIYAGVPEAQALLERYHVDAVLVGPLERATLVVNKDFFAQYPKVAESGAYRLYKIAQR